MALIQETAPALPVLLPEIWSYIISFLRREPPPPFQNRVDWGDFHQQDLTAISRVSSGFHQITIPHLYTSVVIDTLPSFLTHLNDAPPSLVHKITSKMDRIALIQRLRITTIGVPCKPRWSVLQLLTGDFDWDLIAEDVKSFTVRRWSTALQQSRVLIKFLEECPGGVLPIKMPLLDTVILGQMGSCTWDNLFKVPASMSMSHAIVTAQEIFTKAHLKFNPRVICCHSVTHPYALRFSVVNPKCDTAMICMHHYSQFGVAPVTICQGKTQRHYFDPHANAMVHFPKVDRGKIDIYGFAEKIFAVNQDAGTDTSIEFMGYYTGPACLSPKSSDLHNIFGSPNGNNFASHNRRKWEWAKD